MVITHFLPPSRGAGAHIGGLLFLGVVIVGTAAAVRKLVQSTETAWIAMLFLQYLLGAMVSGSLYSSAQMWVLMAFVVATTSASGSYCTLQPASAPDRRCPNRSRCDPPR